MAYILNWDEIYSWPREYSRFIIKTMMQQEEHIPPLYILSPIERERRTHGIYYIKGLCTKCNYNCHILVLSVCLFDHFCGIHDTGYQLYELAFTCVRVAAKYEKGTHQAMSTLQRHLNRKILLNIEKEVLKITNWRLMLPTTSTFACYLMQYAIQPGDIPLHIRQPLAMEMDMRKEINRKLKMYLDRIIDDPRSPQCPPSMLAAACLLATRRNLRLEPAWTSNLVEIIGYEEIDLSPALHVVLNM